MLDTMLSNAGADHIRFLGHVLVNLSSCVTLNRFQAAESVDALETEAHELMKHNSFLASKCSVQTSTLARVGHGLAGFCLKVSCAGPEGEHNLPDKASNKQRNSTLRRRRTSSCHDGRVSPHRAVLLTAPASVA